MGFDGWAVRVGVFCLFSSKMGDIGKREVFPLVLHYDGVKGEAAA